VHSPKIDLTFQIQFSGKKTVYKNVPFQIQKQNATSAHTKGVIHIKLSDFEIKPPSLLAMTINDSVPIDIDAYWTIK